MSDISPQRHYSIFNPAEHNPQIHIIGAGATGSRVWMSLVELGLTNIHTYDYDEVEPHNLANQIFLNGDVGKPKVEALHDMYQLKTGSKAPDTMGFHQVKIDSEFLKENSLPGVVFLLTDTMESRKEISESLFEGSLAEEVDYERVAFLMVETRMASTHGDVFNVNTFDPEMVDKWQKTLSEDSDEDLEKSPCGSTISVGPTANVIANMAVWQFISHFTNEVASEFHLKLFLRPAMISVEK